MKSKDVEMLEWMIGQDSDPNNKKLIQNIINKLEDAKLPLKKVYKQVKKLRDSSRKMIENMWNKPCKDIEELQAQFEGLIVLKARVGAFQQVMDLVKEIYKQ